MTRSMGDQPTQGREDAAPDKDGLVSIGEMLTRRQRERLKTGDVILGRYKILGELGQGGMGLVFRCLDEVSGVEVAVKVLPPEVSRDSGEMEEVRDNFQLVSSLVHQHICSVRTLERDEATGEYYLVMERVEGVNLRRYRKQKGGKLSYDEALPIIRQIAAALDYAHGRKVIHRDIKPSNVMMGTRGEGRGLGDEAAVAVKVLDFGLAAQIHTSFSRVSQVRYGTSGTGPYMAPEQWRGQYQDGATDQYALAVLAYELLTGHCPFESHDTAVLREAVLHDTPAPIPGLPAHAGAALARALSKKREERFASCAEFVEALGGARVGGRGRKRGGSVEGRGHRPGRWLARAAIVVVLAALGLGVWQGLPKWKDYQESRRAEQVALEGASEQARALRADVERALAVGNIEAAGPKLAELESLVGASSVSDLRRRYEASASARQARQRAGVAESAMKRAQSEVEADREGLDEIWNRLESAWLAAERALGSEAWGESLSGYDRVIRESEQIGQRKSERDAARRDRSSVERARTAAQTAGAANRAERLWKQAEASAKFAADAYAGGDYAAASEQWRGAAAVYGQAEEWAKAVAAWESAKSDWEKALSETDRDLVRQYDRETWDRAQAQAGTGARSVDDPKAGTSAYRQALTLLAQAVSNATAKATPSLIIETTAGGRSVRGTISAGGRTWNAGDAIALEKNRSYTFTVSYDDPSGKRWQTAEVRKTADWFGAQTERVVLEESKGPVEGQNWTSPSTGMEFVWIPQMNMWVGKYEVTNGEYRKKEPGHNSREFQGHSLNGDRQPVVQVNFDDAKKYAEWLTAQDRASLSGARYRLPSEQEFMAYAQCGRGWEYPWEGGQWPPRSGRAGNYSDMTARRVLNFTGIDGYNDGHAVSAPVEQSWENPWGLFGVGGNVWEACASDASGNSFGAWRGASWVYIGQDSLRSSYRVGLVGSGRSNDRGFRLVLSR